MSNNISTFPPPSSHITSTTTETARTSADAGKPVSAAAPVDAVHLSADTTSLQSLSDSSGAGASVDHAKVDAVRSAIAAGTYKVDPQKIAGRMLQLEQDLSK